MSANEIAINFLHGDHTIFDLVPLPAKREWMNQTSEAFAYRCTPLIVANTYGWMVSNPEEFTATWDGTDLKEGIEISFANEPPYQYADSHFGHGVLTVSLDFVIRTNPGMSILVRGVPNAITSGLVPLDGIVETDWLPFTFTYNFKFAVPGSITIPKGYPLFSFYPIERGFIESFTMTTQHISEDKEFFADYGKYAKARGEILDGSDKYGNFQKFYPDGVGADGKKFDIKNHNKKTIVAKPE